MTTTQSTWRLRVNSADGITPPTSVETHAIASELDAQSINTDNDEADGYSPDQRLDECTLPQANRELIHQACIDVGTAKFPVNCSPTEFTQPFGGDDDGE
jgi:hypothetical protein